MERSAASIAACALIAAVALIVVGIASGGIARHILQSAPLWLAIWLAARRSTAVNWVGLPLFLFWLAIMVLIWLYLLGLSRIASGTYSAVEIAMTIVIGAASAVGIGIGLAGIRNKWSWAGLGLSLALAAVQVGIMAASLHPPIANDAEFAAWLSAL